MPTIVNKTPDKKKEIQLIFGEVLPQLDEKELERVLGFAEGMAFNKGVKNNA